MKIMAEQLPPQVQMQLARLQDLQEQLRAIVLRKQQIELELREVERALKETEDLSNDVPIYKSVGALLFKTEKEKVVKELGERKEELELRIKTLERQESRVKQQLEELRKSILSYTSQFSAGGGS
ncbi:MAG: prefoldin subunit beta [Candidatus Verstraetearchaeota archaeon]|nr:prefoldin subunit beta [Candidatus Verstraetearchaeota archaeon]